MQAKLYCVLRIHGYVVLLRNTGTGCIQVSDAAARLVHSRPSSGTQKRKFRLVFHHNLRQRRCRTSCYHSYVHHQVSWLVFAARAMFLCWSSTKLLPPILR